MIENPSYYAIIPSSVRYDKDLKANEKLLYGEITSLCNKNGYCYATNEYFAKLYNVHKNTISNWISNLQKKDYINSKILYKNDSKEIDKRILFLGKGTVKEIAEIYCENNQDTINKIINRYQSKDLDTINENTKENNTSINNTTITTIENSKNIFEIIEKNFGRTLAPIEYDKIKEWEDYKFPLDLIKYAVSKAVLNGVYTLNYIDKVLYEWDKNNIRTVVQAKKDDEEYESQRQKQSYRYHKVQHENKERRHQPKKQDETIGIDGYEVF